MVGLGCRGGLGVAGGVMCCGIWHTTTCCFRLGVVLCRCRRYLAVERCGMVVCGVKWVGWFVVCGGLWCGLVCGVG